MNKIIFRLERESADNINVQLTMTGKEEEVAAMLFTAMQASVQVQELILRTVAGYLVVNKVSFAEYENKFT